MGGIEDAEPPLKRVKVPSGDLDKSLDNSSSTKPVFGSLGDSMARPLYSQGDGERIGSKGVIKKHEFVKIITRALYSLGYDRTGDLLQEESGIQLHPSAVSLFMQQVLDGKWDESLATLRSMVLDDESVAKSASFLILEQKFVELLKEGKIMDALHTLRTEIVPLSVKMGRVHELAASMISPSQTVVLGLSSQDNSIAISRSRFLEKLQKLLPAAVMIPERRLENLVEQALDMQRFNCVFHNTLDSELSLLSDHQCGRNQIPSQTLQTFEMQYPVEALTFDGRLDPKAFIDWVNEMEQFFEYHKLSDDRKVRFAKLKLISRAKFFWQNIEAQRRQPPTFDWSEMIEVLSSKYIPHSYQHKRNLEAMQKRRNQFVEVLAQIEKISNELYLDSEETPSSIAVDESDLSLRKLEELHSELRNLQQDKGDC
ncbi:transducin family protein [Actinidia rufa]|uniref:Transducin family protein n=1 Tax=Actinidia rufa TaxID=165716 RepID=A0A7J0DU51_9ERIC|nr:transducin family protein [Actinidia rufa]